MQKQVHVPMVETVQKQVEVPQARGEQLGAGWIGKWFCYGVPIYLLFGWKTKLEKTIHLDFGAFFVSSHFFCWEMGDIHFVWGERNDDELGAYWPSKN